MKMSCETVRRSLGPWLDGELGHSEAEKIESHLRECGSCLEEKARLERVQETLKDILGAESSRIAFEPFWHAVRQRISEKRPWHVEFLDWSREVLRPRALGWGIALAIVLLLGVFSLRDFIPGWQWGLQRANATVVDSIDGYGLNVGLFRDSRTKTTLIWLFQGYDDEESFQETDAG